ncbi:MAG: tetratricopeptide repeat protein [Phycisphaerae bacterium]|jgi:TolA-binding protein
MNKKFVFKFAVIVFLLSLQAFVHAGEPAVSLITSRDKIYNFIDSGKFSEAATVTEKLIADNSNEPSLPKTISNVADYHAKRYDYVRARGLYNRLIQLYPQDKCAEEAELKMIKLDILAMKDAGKEEMANDAIEQLIANNSGKPYFAGAIYDIAREYSRSRQFDKSKDLYQRMIKLCPQDKFANKAKTELMKDEIYTKFEDGNYYNISDLLQNTANSDSDSMAEVLYTAAKKYTEKSEYEKSKVLCSQIIQTYPDNKYSRRAEFWLTKNNILEKICISDLVPADDLTDKLITEYSQDAETPEVLYDAAEYYVKCRNYERAKKLYSRLASLYPENSYSFNAYKEVSAIDIRAKINAGEYESAYKELEQFIDKYGKDSTTARILYSLDNYCWEKCLGSNNYNQVIPILELICDKLGECNHYDTSVNPKLICDTAKICGKIAEGKLEQAQNDTAKLKLNYTNKDNLPLAFYFITKEFFKRGYAEHAEVMCGEIIKLGANRYVIYCDLIKYSLNVRSCLEKNDLAGAKQVFNQFKTKYSNSPFAEKGLIDLVAEFYDKGLRCEGENGDAYFKEAIKLCQAEKLTESVDPAGKIRIYKMLGDSFLRTGEYVKSADYFQRILELYPDSGYAWNTQFMTAQVYENMRRAKIISGNEADGKIRIAYQRLLERYPNCKAAPIARKWLENHN